MAAEGLGNADLPGACPALVLGMRLSGGGGGASGADLQAATMAPTAAISPASSQWRPVREERWGKVGGMVRSLCWWARSMRAVHGVP